MDLIQRAANLFDRAQGRVASATNQAARIVVTASQMRTLEARQAELRQQIEHHTVELGKLTFQRWKNHGVGNDAALAGLCSQIDALNAEYQQVVTELADARAALAEPAPYAMPPSDAITASIGPYYPQPSPGMMPSSTSHLTTTTASVLPEPLTLGLLPPPAPLRPARPARECPECYSLVPGTADFCPSCGMRVPG